MQQGTSTAESDTGQFGNFPARLLVSNAPTIEMAEINQLELYTMVQAGCPIIVQFYNESMTEKWMWVKFITLQDEIPAVNLSTFKWYHEWNGYHVNMFGTQEFIERIRVPDFVNSNPSMITHVQIIAKELIVTGRRIATIEVGSTVPGGISSTFLEDMNGSFAAFPSWARSGPILITNVEIIRDSINGDHVEITFRRVEISGNPWVTTGRINMTLSITITNQLI